jgi:hypothetical protein
MSFYYVQTIAGQQTCIKKHSRFPLPGGVAANCADDLDLPANLQKVGTADVPCTALKKRPSQFGFAVVSFRADECRILNNRNR